MSADRALRIALAVLDANPALLVKWENPRSSDGGRVR